MNEPLLAAAKQLVRKKNKQQMPLEAGGCRLHRWFACCIYWDKFITCSTDSPGVSSRQRAASVFLSGTFPKIPQSSEPGPICDYTFHFSFPFSFVRESRRSEPGNPEGCVTGHAASDFLLELLAVSSWWIVSVYFFEDFCWNCKLTCSAQLQLTCPVNGSSLKGRVCSNK